MRRAKPIRKEPPKRGTTWAQVCKMARKLPGVEEGRSYGTPALHVCKKFMARLKEDGESIAIRIDFAMEIAFSDGCRLSAIPVARSPAPALFFHRVSA